MHRVFAYPFASIYPLYVTKVEKKGRSVEELDEVLTWLTGYDAGELAAQRESGATLEEFFAGARLNDDVDKITGVVCGVRVEDIEDPLLQRIRYMDKLVDELARGKAMAKILRSA